MLDPRLEELTEVTRQLTNAIQMLLDEHTSCHQHLEKAVVDTNWDEVTKVRMRLMELKDRVLSAIELPAPVEPVMEPAVEPAVEPVMEPAVEPAFEPAVEPVMEPAAEPSVE